MERTTGRYVDGSMGEARYRAYVPNPLPPEPPLRIEGPLLSQLERANQALGRLDGISLLLPDPDLFLYSFVRKEALLSSQIEGTQSSLSDLLLFELDELPGVPVDDVEEVSNYVAAMQHGLQRIREDFPLSLRLLREIHERLLAGGRGATKTPGEFRTGQNWIGGRSPSTARFVPPPPDYLADCLTRFERFLHAPREEMPPLLKAALAHVQFETIHPFNDGNGRLGRLLIALLLCHDEVLRQPSLYLSLFFKTRREAYYEHLQQVRVTGDWEGWLQFFLEGVEVTSNQAVTTAQRTLALFGTDRLKLAGMPASVQRVFEDLTKRPVQSVPKLQQRLGMTSPTVRTAIRQLAELEIVNEITGQQRNRIYVYDQYYQLLAEGAQPL